MIKKESFRGQNNDMNSDQDKTSRRLNIQNKEKAYENSSKISLKYIFIFLIIPIIIGGTITLIIFLINKKNHKKHMDEEIEDIIRNNTRNFFLKVNDLKRISIEEKYNENILEKDINTKNFLYKNKTYDIFVFSEQNNIYSASISIQSECISTNNECCNPKKLVDLTEQNNLNLKNLRNLEEIDDFKDIPISLCLVNFTQNNSITSVLCPKSLPLSKKIEIILDFIKYLKGNSNNDEEIINKKNIKEIIDNKEYIIEKMEIKDNNSDSENLKEINKTIDLEGNFISYDLNFLFNKTIDEHNSYTKDMKMKIKDNTKNIKIYSHENYKIILNKLLSKLNPYLQSEEKLSDFISKNITKRRLSPENQYIIDEENLFSYNNLYNGINLSLNFKNNGGYNTETMGVYSYLLINDKINELVNRKQFSNFNKIFTKLSKLEKASNNLVLKLYNNISDNLNNITHSITDTIISLKNNIMYKDLSDIFDSKENIKKLPFNTIEEFNLLENKLNEILNEIEEVDFMKNIRIINDNIYDFIKDSHIIINNIYLQLQNLTNDLASSKNEIFEISNYFLNKTTLSIIDIIKNSKNKLLNYYEYEKDLIMPKIGLLLEEFEKNLNKSIEKELKIIDSINFKLQNKSIIIENATEVDYSKILLTINKIINNFIQISDKIKSKIKKEINLKDNDNFISNFDIKSNNVSFNYIIDKAINISNKIENKEFIDNSFNDIMISYKKNFSLTKNYIDQIIDDEYHLDENILKDTYFTLNEQNNIVNDLKTFSFSILDKIQKENDLYIREINKTIDLFLKGNKEYLNNIISELNIIFSDEILEKLSFSFENAFENTLNEINNNINYNDLLSNNYFNELYYIVNNDTNLLNILKLSCDETFLSVKPYPYLVFCPSKEEYHCVEKVNCNDTLINKMKTNSYINKYTFYKEMMNYSNFYIKEKFNMEIYNKYKESINKIKNLKYDTFKFV